MMYILMSEAFIEIDSLKYFEKFQDEPSRPTKNPLHGEQFRTVSGLIRRLTLSLINLVKTLETTTKQLKNIILHILKQKQIRKKTKTQVFLLLHICTINSRNVTSLCHAKSHNAKKYCSKLLVKPTSVSVLGF